MPDYSWYDTSQVITPGAESAGIGSSVPEWLTSTGNLGLFDSDTFSNLGYGGDLFSREGSGLDSSQIVSPEFSNWMQQQGYSITPSSQGYSTLADKEGKELSRAYGRFNDPLFGSLVDIGVGAVTGGALGGGGLAGGFGMSPGALANMVNAGAAGMFRSPENPLQGAAQGAVTGGLSSGVQALNPAQYVGIESPSLAGMFNKGAGNFTGALASGANSSQALSSGVTGALTSGLNSAGKNMSDYFKSLFADSSPDAYGLSGDPAMNASYGSNYTPTGAGVLRDSGLGPQMSYVPPSSSNFSTLQDMMLPQLSSDPRQNASYPEGGYKPNGVSVLEQSGLRPEMSYAPGQEMMPFLRSFTADSGIQSAAPSSSGMADFGGKLGNFALNNAGDLVSMLYGIYNNRKQRGALQNQINGLQGLYSQNSPYAQQLRGKLQAQAAAKGTRLNTSGRETQLQAMLADRASSLAPSLYQMQQGVGGMDNRMLDTVLMGMNKMGGWKALSDLFKG